MVITGNNGNSLIAVILPTKNEELAMRTGLVRRFKEYADVIVVDGNSSDRTRYFAERDGALFLNFKDKGKGEGLGFLQTYIRQHPEKFGYKAFVLNDGDCTCKPEDVERLAEPIISGRAEVVIGVRRFDKSKPCSFRSIQEKGNHAAAEFANILYLRRDLKDVATPSWAFTDYFLTDEPSLISKHFDSEGEFLARTILGGYSMEEVEVETEERVGKSKFLGLGYVEVPWFLLKHRALGSFRYSKKLGRLQD